jgi:hypothetical protein
MTQLDYSWAQHLLVKYEQENDLTLNESDDISGILQRMMYEKDFYCESKELEDIVDMLIRIFLKK